MANDILTAAPETLDVDAFIAQGNAIASGEEVPAPAEPAEGDESDDTPSEPEPQAPPPPAPAQPSDDDLLATNVDGSYKVKASPKRRIDAAIARQREAERRLSEAERRAQQAEARVVQPAPPVARVEAPRESDARAPEGTDDPEPQLEQFAKDPDPYSAWMRATAKWEGRNETRRLMAEGSARAAQVAEHRAWQENITAAKSRIENFDTRIDPETPIDARILPYLRRHELGPDVLVYLSEHQDFAQGLLTLHPVEQIGAIGEIVGQLKTRSAAAIPKPAQQTKPQPISQAQPPPQPVGGSPVVSSDAEDEENLPVDDFIRRGNKRDPRFARR